MNFFNYFLLEAFQEAKEKIQQNIPFLRNITLSEEIVDIIAEVLSDIEEKKIGSFFEYLIGAYSINNNLTKANFEKLRDNYKYYLFKIKGDPQYRYMKEETPFELGKTYDDKITKIYQKEKLKHKRKVKESGELLPEDNPTVIHDDGTYKIYKINGVKDKEDIESVEDKHRLLCYLGKKTEWCTARASGTAHESHAEDDIYIVYKDEKPLYQFSNSEIKDTEDKEVNILKIDYQLLQHLIKFDEIKKLIVDKLVNSKEPAAIKIPQKTRTLIASKSEEINTLLSIIRKNPPKNINYLIRKYPSVALLYATSNKVTLTDEVITKSLANNIDYLFNYLHELNLKRRFPEEVEKRIATGERYFITYMADILAPLKQRFSPEIEKIIMQDHYKLLKYIEYVIKEIGIPIPEEFKKELFKSDIGKYWYLKVSEDTFPDNVEDIIEKDISVALDYAERTKKRLPANVEKKIFLDKDVEWEYFLDIVFPSGDFSEEEIKPNLLDNPQLCVYYAQNFLAKEKRRFPEELESTIFKCNDSNLIFSYFKDILFPIGVKLPKSAEKVILTHGDNYVLPEYAKLLASISNEKIPPYAEKRLLNFDNLSSILDYAQVLIRFNERLPKEVEERILKSKNKYLIDEYVGNVLIPIGEKLPKEIEDLVLISPKNILEYFRKILSPLREKLRPTQLEILKNDKKLLLAYSKHVGNTFAKIKKPLLRTNYEDYIDRFINLITTEKTNDSSAIQDLNHLGFSNVILLDNLPTTTSINQNEKWHQLMYQIIFQSDRIVNNKLSKKFINSIKNKLVKVVTSRVEQTVTRKYYHLDTPLIDDHIANQGDFVFYSFCHTSLNLDINKGNYDYISRILFNSRLIFSQEDQNTIYVLRK